MVKMASQHGFILAVFLMYGTIFMIYSMSGGAIFPDLDNDALTAFNTIGTSGVETASFTDWLTGGISILISFFVILFVPITSLWYFVPINWALIGTASYLFFKLIRGGG